MEINAQNIIIYNLSDIDSVISAALYRNDMSVAFPASNKIPKLNGKSIYWMGVVPTEATLANFSGCYHYAFYPSADAVKINPKFAEIATYIVGESKTWGEELPDDEMPIVANTTFKAVSAHLSIFSNYQFNEILAKFIHGQAVTIEEQALVHHNYYEALKRLNAGIKQLENAAIGDSPTVSCTPQMVNDYQSHMREIKRQISRLFEYFDFKMDGSYIKVPLLNVNQDLTPWVMRLLAITYDFAITYEHQRQHTVYNMFSRIAGFDNSVIRQVSDGKNIRFSHVL